MAQGWQNVKDSVATPGGMAEWIAPSLHMWEVYGSHGSHLAWAIQVFITCIKRRRWCIHPGFKTYGRSQLEVRNREHQWLHKMLTSHRKKKNK